MGRSVAIKLAHQRDRRPDEASSHRLMREAKATASLCHPAIVEVLDFRMVGQEAFVVMELLHGESLRTRFRHEGGMSAVDAVRTLLPILGALGHAHSRGVVHLDVKPDNIFLARGADGRIEPKLVDFGLAKTDWEETEPSGANTALLVGSPAYMSPEQGRGRGAVDSRADLWAFAVVLYEAIAVKTPWEAPSWPALLHAIAVNPAPSLLGRRDVDEAFWDILQRGLEKNPDARWQTSHEFAASLADWLTSHDVAAAFAQDDVDDGAESHLPNSGVRIAPS
jgi:serine/threonine-protein kinase